MSVARELLSLARTRQNNTDPLAFAGTLVTYPSRGALGIGRPTTRVVTGLGLEKCPVRLGSPRAI